MTETKNSGVSDICNLCPKKCGVDRDLKKGFCNQNNDIKISLYQLHKFEEPVISGKNGSGAIFFCGCNMRCKFCQNSKISRGGGKTVTNEELTDIFNKLINMGTNNINLVTPTHYTKKLSEILENKFTVPIVWNSSGYELPESINEELEKQGMSEILNKVEIPKEELKECVSRIINQSSADAADYITQKTIKPVLVGIVRSAVFIACLIGASIVINIIVAIAGLRKPDHELSAADHFAGLVLGAIKGLLICAMFAWLLSTFCTLTDNSLKLFNSGVSDKTYLFRYFFDYFYR